jgi:FOG: GGDEF domain
MKNKFIGIYGIIAFVLLASSLIWFTLSVSSEARRGSLEAERSFSWISRESSAAAVASGFMTDEFVRRITELSQKSRLLSAVVISTPSGAVFAWPDSSASISYDISGQPRIVNTSLFMKVYSTKLDIGDNANGSVVMTAVLYALHPDAIYSASRTSFLVVLALILVTLIVILVQYSGNRAQKPPASVSVPKVPSSVPEPEKTKPVTASNFDSIMASIIDESSTPVIPVGNSESDHEEEIAREEETAEIENLPEIAPAPESADPLPETVSVPVSPEGFTAPEGLFSPASGIGWEQYLSDRLDAELVRAASSEQDLSLVIIRISGLVHTDLLSRKVAQILMDTFRFRDLVFEFGTNGFAGILLNMNLDQAMKIADTVYASIDSILMELSSDGQITIGITTRTARLLPASRMIEEAVSAARKAEEEPSLPIVAFRANPEKYRNFVSGNS